MDDYGTVTVLLVEDNEVDIEAIQRAFKRYRIANPLVVAHNSEEARHRLKGTGGYDRISRPFLILLDLNLPGMTGIEFLAELRADPEFHEAVVFVVTTSRSVEDKLASYDLNVAGYIVKSDIGQDFLSLVDMLDHYWRVVSFPPERS